MPYKWARALTLAVSLLGTFGCDTATDKVGELVQRPDFETPIRQHIIRRYCEVNRPILTARLMDNFEYTSRSRNTEGVERVRMVTAWFESNVLQNPSYQVEEIPDEASFGRTYRITFEDHGQIFALHHTTFDSGVNVAVGLEGCIVRLANVHILNTEYSDDRDTAEVLFTMSFEPNTLGEQVAVVGWTPQNAERWSGARLTAVFRDLDAIGWELQEVRGSF